MRARRNRGYLDRWRQRFGIYHGVSSFAETIWVHAVSVGESAAAVPLIRALYEKCGDIPLLVTTTTPTGAETVQRLLGDIAYHVYFPYDLPFVLGRFLAKFKPRLCIVIETELWPNTFELCRARGIPIVLANARLSSKSFNNYRRLQPLARDLVQAITCIAAQSNDDAQRFLDLGASPDNIKVLGSLKFDFELPASLREEAEALRRELGVSRPIFMAGSTRAGEEKILLEAFALLRKHIPNALLVIAPRHPERFSAVAALCRESGAQVSLRSHFDSCAAATDVYLVDGIGELPKFYAAADVAFVGGSLLPFGGHNVIEPASLGVPVLVGPYTFNFVEICRLLADGGALRVVDNAASIAACCGAWLADSNERDRVGHIGRDIVRRHRGATARTINEIRAILSSPAVAPEHPE